MRDIAAAADVNDALLYRYFKSKAHLFDVAVSGPLDEAVAHTFVTASGEDDVRAVAERFFPEVMAATGEIFPLLTVVLADAERGEAFYREHLRPAIDQVVEATRSNLDRWEHQRFDPEVLVRLAWGVCWVSALDERFGEAPVERDSVVSGVVDLLWNGLKSRAPGAPK